MKKLGTIFNDSESIVDQVKKISSLVVAIDPNVPSILRMVWRESENGGSDRFSVILSSDTRENLDGFIDDHYSMNLLNQNVVANVLGSEDASAIFRRLKDAIGLDERVSDVDFEMALGAVIRDGMKGDLKEDLLRDHGETLVYSSPYNTMNLSFARDPDFVEMAVSKMNRPANGVDDDAHRFVGNIQSVRASLTKDMSEVSVPRMKDVVQKIKEINKDFGGKFEEEMGKSWISYSLIGGGEGWESFLIKERVANPSASFSGVTPTVSAIIMNKPESLASLIDAGISPNAQLRDPASSSRLHKVKDIENRFGSQMGIASFAAAIGSTESAMKLVQLGADMDQKTSHGYSLLDIADDTGNERLRHSISIRDFDGEEKKHSFSPMRR